MDLSYFKDNYISDDYINIFYENYPLFDILFYKKIIEILNIKYDNLLVHYHTYGNKNNILCSIKYFYNLYPLFDILFYQKIYYNSNYKDYIEYLIDYHECMTNNKLKFCSLDNFENYYKIDYDFIQVFYDVFNKIELIKDIDNYILSNQDFNNKFPNFNINICKKYYSTLIFDNDIKYKSYWFHNKINSISSLEDIIHKYNFEIILYKYTYNLDYETDENIILHWIDNKNNSIYSVQTYFNTILDFNYNLFIKHFPIVKWMSKFDIINYYVKNINKINYIYSIQQFYIQYPNFNLEEYKKKNKVNSNFEFNIINEFYQSKKNIYENIKLNADFNITIYKYFNEKNLYEKIIYSIDSFYKIYNTFNKDLYILLNNLEYYSEEALIIHFHSIGLKLNLAYNEYTIPQFSIKIYKELNLDLINLNNVELVIHWYNKGQYEGRIFSIETFNKIYPDINLNDEEKIIYWMTKGIYLDNTCFIGREIVNNIYEVLIDLSNPLPKNKLEDGISLIIRAKNEECNIDQCINSVIDLVDEIIFVDNNSTDSTYNFVKKYSEKYDKIKLYQYKINVNRVGIQHQEAIKNNNRNTLGTFYNWCLSKSTKKNVFKWDADFICIRNNFNQLVDTYNLRKRDDKFAIWFTGSTLFENNDNIYLNPNSFYNEFRIFSYKNHFSWYDGEVCEYTEPYLASCIPNKKYRYEYPLFYELKRTSVDEFQERSSLIDSRDINDFNILDKLKQNNNINLIPLNYNIIYKPKRIIIYTPSLNFGGGNQFVINIYKLLKYIGYIIYIFPVTIDKKTNKFNVIINDDIKEEKLTINYINEFKPDIILFNSDIPFDNKDIRTIGELSKIIFITHSDVAYSNYFIYKYHLFFDLIITVNNYTIQKLSSLLNINESMFFKIINYIDFNIKKVNNKNYSFGIISRFSEDKNIPMFIISLSNIFKKYPNYKCYLVGTDSKYYDDYLKYLCKLYNLDKNIIFTGFQEDVAKYYQLFDFIVLPSVSEGCSYNIIEAMNIGLPVVTSNVGGNHELIKDTINGILYDYTGIRDFEKKTVYIKNYNEQLSNIGYIINNDKYIYNYNISAFIPQYTICKNNHTILDNNCILCKNIIDKNNLFNLNVNKITESILKMIELDNESLIKIRENNIEFIKNNFNQEIYINQVLNIINN